MRAIFRFLFHPGRRGPSGGLPHFLVEAAIERTVDRTDKRLRALSSYRKTLRDPVAAAIRHVIRLVDQLPPAIDLSPRSYGREPTLRAAFASADHLRDTLGRLHTVRDYLNNPRHRLPAEIFGLMTMSQHRHHVLGMELQGDVVVRDVLQTAVSFSDFRFIAPADREMRTRRELKIRAFDFLLETTVQRIGTEKARRAGLILQRDRLRREIGNLESERNSRCASSRRRAQVGETVRLLRADLQKVDTGLGRYPAAQLSLEDSLEIIVSTLSRAADMLVARPLCETLDYRGIKIRGKKAASIPPLRAIEFTSPTGLKRAVFLGRIQRNDMPPPIDVVKRGESVLGEGTRPTGRASPGT